jgi:RNA polymerase sigma-70 factor (ECF subfamily)
VPEALPPYDKLFKKYWKQIFYFCNKKLKDEDLAKDVAEESFIKTWSAYGKFVSEENAKAFVYVVARNACFNELERIKRYHLVDIDLPIFEAWLFEMPKYEMAVIEAEVIAFVHQEIKKLPPRMRQAVELLMAGNNSTQAGQSAGITRKTILNQKLKAIKYLRNKVKLKFDI